jgi:FkbM family methyltransferase
VIVAGIVSGLGNQMFQYAFGLRVAVGLGVPLKLDLAPMRRDVGRRYGLDQLRVEAVFATPLEVRLAREGDDRQPRGEAGPPARGLARRLARRPALGPRLVKERDTLHDPTGFAFDPSKLDAPDGSYLEGYWQSEKYFAPVAARLREQFRLRHGPAPADREVLARIAACASVSVHVRRGDYVDHPDAVFDVCDPAYFERCGRYIAERVDDPCFFVFSDDPEWARRNLRLPGPTTFVTHNGPGQEARDMHLMAACRHHVIANSSFSWWGAWLDPRPDKLVLRPRQWLRDRPPEAVPDVTPHDWVAIENGPAPRPAQPRAEGARRLTWVEVAADPAYSVAYPEGSHTHWDGLGAGPHAIGDYVDRYRGYLTGAPSDAFAIDVGANIGLSAFPIASLGRRVVAFEPEPDNLEGLRAGVERNGFETVTVVPCAASAEAGEVALFTPSGRADNSSLGVAAATANVAADVTLEHRVRAETLDGWFAEHRGSFAPADAALLKIDVQGYEEDVLRGARELIAACRPFGRLAVEFEFDPGMLALAQRSPLGLLELVDSLGLTVYAGDTAVAPADFAGFAPPGGACDLVARFGPAPRGERSTLGARGAGVIDWHMRYAKLLSTEPGLFDEARSVLEVGSGRFGAAAWLQRPVTGVSPAWPLLPGPLVTPVCGDLLALPFDDATFDHVLCVDVLEHVPHDERAAVVRELVRVCRGRLLIGGPFGEAAAQGERAFAELLRDLDMEAPDWLDEHLRLGIPGLEEVVAPLLDAGCPFAITGNESRLQHFSGLLLELALPAALEWNVEHASKTVLEPPVGAGAWEEYYSYLIAADVGERRLPAPAEPPAPSGPPAGRALTSAVYAVAHDSSQVHDVAPVRYILAGPAAEGVAPGEAGASTQPPLVDAGYLANDRWSELSAIYSVWKDGPVTDVVGFCHYRRFFDFGGGSAPARETTIAPADIPGVKSRFTCPELLPEVASGLVLVTRPLELDTSVFEHYCRCHNGGDYLTLLNVVAASYPRLLPYLAEDFTSTSLQCNNMFVMSWGLFDWVCSIWFPCLEEVSRRLGHDRAPGYQGRDVAFLSERLLGAVVKYLTASGIEVREIPLFYVDDGREPAPTAADALARATWPDDRAGQAASERPLSLKARVADCRRLAEALAAAEAAQRRLEAEISAMEATRAWRLAVRLYGSRTLRGLQRRAKSVWRRPPAH